MVGGCEGAGEEVTGGDDVDGVDSEGEAGGPRKCAWSQANCSSENGVSWLVIVTIADCRNSWKANQQLAT